MILLSGLLVAAVALYPLSHLDFRDGLQALLKNFDIAREQYQRGAGTHWYYHFPVGFVLFRGQKRFHSSYSRKRVSRCSVADWIPAFAGMTKIY